MGPVMVSLRYREGSGYCCEKLSGDNKYSAEESGFHPFAACGTASFVSQKLFLESQGFNIVTVYPHYLS